MNELGLRRSLRFASIALGIALLCGCETTQPEGDDSVVLRWMSSCDASGATPSFSLIAQPNDEILFVGGARTRVTEQLREQFPAGTTKRELSIVRSANRASQRAPKSDSAGERRFCVEVERKTGTQVSLLRWDSESPAGIALKRQLSAALPIEKWACPYRPLASGRTLAVPPFCEGASDLPTINAQFGTGATCSSVHMIYVFEDGTVYYGFNENRKRGLMPLISGERFYGISTSAVDRLVNVVASFDINQETTSSLCQRGKWIADCGPDTTPFITTDLEELARFRRALALEVPIQWVGALETPSDCAPGDTGSYLSLSYSLAVKHGKKPNSLIAAEVSRG